MTIRLFATGGTFDKEYDYIHGTLDFSSTQLPGMLRQGRSTLDIKLRTLMMKDSLEFTDHEREFIAKPALNVRKTGLSLHMEQTPWRILRGIWPLASRIKP